MKSGSRCSRPRLRTARFGAVRSRPSKAKFDGTLWFFTKLESPKAEEVRRHRRVSLSYAKPEDNSYVSISGTAELIYRPEQGPGTLGRKLRTMVPTRAQ